MKVAWWIARHELTLMVRTRLATIATILVIALTATAAWLTHASSAVRAAEQARLQSRIDAEFDRQPDRHPHRMVHYGHFVFRPVGPLAAFDPGIEPFVGRAIYLEGHRQNSANFADVRQSSLLLRFGFLTPAFVLQTIAPLLVVILGYGLLARERAHGGLRLLLTQGASLGSVVAGKCLALAIAANLAVAPAILSLLLLGRDAQALPTYALLGAYTAHLLFWALITIAVSLMARTPAASLNVLLSAWAVLVIMIPRVGSDLAAALHPLTTRAETDIVIQNDLRSIGDSHDPDDPYFAAFERSTLDRYGVARVEDLPVNYRGLLAVEGERLTSKLFDEYALRDFAAQIKQRDALDRLALVSPLPALRRASMALAGTDLEAQWAFLLQAEAYRFAFVQHLNELQATAVTFADEAARDTDPVSDRRTRIDREHWAAVADFAYQPARASTSVQNALPALGAVAIWFAIAACALVAATARARRFAL
jgi:ABC-2 type transport system permease protein